MIPQGLSSTPQSIAPDTLVVPSSEADLPNTDQPPSASDDPLPACSLPDSPHEVQCTAAVVKLANRHHHKSHADDYVQLGSEHYPSSSHARQSPASWRRLWQ